MTIPFLSDDFLLTSVCARRLFHDYAKEMPIFDYHCHLPVQQIAQDSQFENLTRIWLAGDHYKWRAMRSDGVDERYCTGDAPDREKFRMWAATVPHTVRNPLYVWTHLELRRYFGITAQLGPDNADAIYDQCNEQLATPQFSVRSLLRRMNVRALCTTDDPIDTLEWHQKIASDQFDVRVLPTFRPDKAMAAENPQTYNAYLDTLQGAADMQIATYDDLVEAIRRRHHFFHTVGCRLSDHGLETAYADDFTMQEITSIFDTVRGGHALNQMQVRMLKSALMLEFGRMDAQAGWVQQLHLGAQRNNNSRLFAKLGPDTGFDSIGDQSVALPLARFLDRLDSQGLLPRTILYTLNAADNDILATMLGNFQDGSIAGKMQFGSGWWFHDQRDGMEKQINALSTLGLLSRFIGMLTDSRSFLSYPRHEYFRRILCRQIAADVELGEIPCDYELLGPMVRDICYTNVSKYITL